MNLLSRLFKSKPLDTFYSLTDIERGHHKMTYQGVPCLKCPFDYVIYQMILNEVKPDLIIEIGTNHGGTALYLANIMDSIGKGVIHTIDIDDRAYSQAKDNSRIKFFHRGWKDYNLKLAEEFDKILIIEDSSHDYQNTLDAINHFSHLVTPGSYLIVEDGIIDALGWTDQFNGGPVKAIKQFLTVNDKFEVDYKWINFFGPNATFNTMGYLKRIK